MQTFYQILAMTAYSVVTWFVIQTFITGVKRAIAKTNFNQQAFIVGFFTVSIIGAVIICNYHPSPAKAQPATVQHHKEPVKAKIGKHYNHEG